MIYHLNLKTGERTCWDSPKPKPPEPPPAPLSPMQLLFLVAAACDIQAGIDRDARNSARMADYYAALRAWENWEAPHRYSTEPARPRPPRLEY